MRRQERGKETLKQPTHSNSKLINTNIQRKFFKIPQLLGLTSKGGLTTPMSGILNVPFYLLLAGRLESP